MGGIDRTVDVAVYRVDHRPFTRAACDRAIGLSARTDDIGVIELKVNPDGYHSATGVSRSGAIRPHYGMCFVPVGIIPGGINVRVQGYLNDGPDVELTFVEGASDAVLNVTGPQPTSRTWHSYRRDHIC